MGDDRRCYHQALAVEEGMKYILAVSGGVDSVVMLHMIASGLILKGGEYVVAHVDHGIRSDSFEDNKFVERLAKQYGLIFASTRLELGNDASEEAARVERYGFLQVQKNEHNADAIVTAHHQDDVLETIAINSIRGTGWRGLCSLRERPGLVRPLLDISKAEIISYAINHDLEWREDSTNDSKWYLRNYLRAVYMPCLDPSQRQKLIALYKSQCNVLSKIDDEIDAVYPNAMVGDRTFSRYWLIMSGKTAAIEMIMRCTGTSFEQHSRNRIWHFVCTARSNKKYHENGLLFCATPRQLIVSRQDI